MHRFDEEMKFGLQGNSHQLISNLQEILVPMVHYTDSFSKMVGDVDEGKENLRIIKKFSPLQSDADIKRHFTELGSSGTRIIIWNLRHEDQFEETGECLDIRQCEFDFFSDLRDIRIHDFSKKEVKPGPRYSFFSSLLSPLSSLPSPLLPLFFQGCHWWSTERKGPMR